MSAIVEWYKDVMENKNDPRTADWFLISGPGPLLTILATYIYFCTSAGPKYMRDRKPYNLKYTLIIYNLFQVLFSIYLVYEGLMSGWLYEYNYSCEPVNYTNDPTALRMTRAVYLYFSCKLIELLDTVFFVLRKKQNQVSFLHLYHHSLMPVCSWVGVKFFPGGQGTLLGVINSFVHIFMYTYYLLAAFGPHMQRYLWWKKYLTIMQLVQFLIILLHNVQAIYFRCTYPTILSVLLIMNSSFFIYLFGSFYLKAYIKSNQTLRNRKKEIERKENQTGMLKDKKSN